MERGSSKHSPHVDDDMAREAQAFVQGSPDGSRTDEWRGSEMASDDAPEPQTIPEGPRPEGAPRPLTGEELEARSQLGRAVPLSALPGDRQQIIAGAEQLRVPPEIRAELERLPDGRTYETIYDIWEALGYRNEDPQPRP